MGRQFGNDSRRRFLKTTGALTLGAMTGRADARGRVATLGLGSLPLPPEEVSPSGLKPKGPQTASAMYDPNLHLFVDDSGVERAWQMARVLGVPQRLPTPLIIADRPWETGADHVICLYGGFGSVFYDPDYQKFRMWYRALNHEIERKPDEPDLLCYAESTDGIDWVKPSLGLIDYKGSKDNNAVYRADSNQPTVKHFLFGVIRDKDSSDPAQRYIGFGWARTRGFHVLTSPDGLHWSGTPKLVSTYGGDTNSVAFDPIRNVYILAGREHGLNPSKDEDRAGGPFRSVGIFESSTLDRWHYQGSALKLDEEDGFGRNAQHWVLVPFVYGNQYLGVLNIAKIRVDDKDKHLRLVTNPDGAWRLELASSRDGRSWDYVVRRRTFMPPSPGGYWDGALLCLASGPPIPVGDYLYFYYTSRFKNNAIGLMKVRRDRFAGLRSGDGQDLEGDSHATSSHTLEPVWGSFRPPYVFTKPVKIAGPKLQVNLNAQPGGVLRVSVRQPYSHANDWKGDPIAGYTSEECVPLSGDGTRMEVHWKSHNDISELVGREVTLMFELKDGTLWSFRFGQ